jgi:hypothetical protein
VAPKRSTSRGARALLSLLVAPLLLGTRSVTASARTLAEVPYTRAQTFSAALRYLRVDLGYEVTEKDADAAYLLFAYTTSDRKSEGARGAIEVIQREHGVRVFVSLPQLPSYHEEVLKQGLVRKLVAEYGEPEKEREKPPAPDRNKPDKSEPPPPSEPPKDEPAPPRDSS